MVSFTHKTIESNPIEIEFVYSQPSEEAGGGGVGGAGEAAGGTQAGGAEEQAGYGYIPPKVPKWLIAIPIVGAIAIALLGVKK